MCYQKPLPVKMGKHKRVRPSPFLASVSGILLILRYIFWTPRLKVGLRMSCPRRQHRGKPNSDA